MPRPHAIKRRILRSVSLLSLISAVSLTSCVGRYNFSDDHSPSLGCLQRALRLNPPPQTHPTTRPQIIGHRGSGLEIADGKGTVGNTRRSIQKGIASGADWIEIDLRLSCDGQLAVFHDDTLDRVTGQSGNVAELPLSTLTSIEIPTKQKPLDSIPSFREILEEFAPQGTRFVLDLKVSDTREELIPLLDELVAKDQVILIGAYEAIKEFKGSSYPLGYTALASEGWNSLRFCFDHSYLLQRCQSLGPECQYLILPYRFLNQTLIDEAKLEGLKIWTYHGETPNSWHQSVQRGVSGLIVDRVKEASSEFPATGKP